MVEALPVGYYLDNFSYVLDFVTTQYADLLTPEEAAFAGSFEALPLDARRLYVRLCSRKGPLFRDDKLNYAEIDTQCAIEALAHADFVDFATDAGIADLLALLTRAELLAFRSCDADKSASRGELLEQLAGTVEPEFVHARTPFAILRPLYLDILRNYKLLFFGNVHQDLTEFVLRDLGISPYESYVIHPEDRFFDDRAVLEETLKLYELGERAYIAVEECDIDGMNEVVASIDEPLDRALKRKAAKVRNRIARQFERLDMADRALELYRLSDVAPSRERQARILDRQGLPAEAVARCREILENPENEAEYEFAVSFARRVLGRRGGEDCRDLPEIRPDDFPTREIAVMPDPSVNVEELARTWFEVNGHRAWYVENSLFPGLFGLAFWDIIFMPRKGVFFNPFQRGPSDLFAPEFREAVAEAIDARMDELGDAARFSERVIDGFRSKIPTANHFVNWNVLTEPLLLAAFERIPVAHMLAVFDRLLRDLKSNRSGFPDLVVFPDHGGYLLAEVKGPGDSLQANQKRWLRFFLEQGIAAEVVNVGWVGA